MRALFYADWCSLRSVMLRYLGVTALILTPLVVLTNEESTGAPGVFAASIFTAMLLFYAMLALFTGDEQGEWEQMRTTLPLTRRTVVRERYAFLALTAVALAVCGTIIGLFANAVLSALAVLTVPRGIGEVFSGAFGSAIGALAYLALLMPYVFKVGMSKARIAFSLPFVACMLVTVGPVRDVLVGIVAWLEGTTRALGSPLPLIAAGVAGVAALYVASMLASERLYAAREL